MKKVFLAITVSITLVLLCSCSYNHFKVTRNNIESIMVDDVEYKTIYLYSFRDANTNGEFACKTRNHNILHDSYGYTYSSQKSSPGDAIKVWHNCFFSKNNSNSITYSSSDFGATAIVEEIIDTYRIEVKETKDTYIITYFKTSGFDTATNKEDLDELKKNTIEVTKNRATIKYESE